MDTTYIWFFAVIMYKYNGIRCNSLKDIEQRVGRVEEPIVREASKSLHEELVNNAITAYDIVKESLEEDM